ncbi:DUF4199 domain-containing protein [Dokdonella sp.]|uniref:DUF4199 domain-containing protein n=1 Tax=Dokdonella sp. TaxID=2291710 RepID=UPI003C462C9C
MLKQILKYGLIAGLIAGIPMLGLTLAMKDHPPTSWGMAVGYLTMLIAFTTIFLAIKRKRDIEHGGIIRFWPAVGLGLGISVIASVIYVLCWEAALAASGIDFIGAYSETLIEEQKAKGASAEAIAALAAEMQQLATDYANPLFRMPLTFTEIFPIGVLVTLVSAGLLRNSRFLPLQRT